MESQDQKYEKNISNHEDKFPHMCNCVMLLATCQFTEFSILKLPGI